MLCAPPMTDRAAPAPTLSSGYIPTLDGWRAIAILLVLVCHGGDALFHATGVLPSGVLHRVTRHFAFGVDIFFGLSGLLITSRLLAQWGTPPGALLRGFYVRRLFRILPPYLTYLAAVGLLAAAGWLPVSPSELLSCVLFVRNYLPVELGGWYTGQFWSLAIEEHFYLLWPALLVLFGAGRMRYLALLFAVGIALWRLAESKLQLLPGLLPEVSFHARTDTRLDSLFLGCWVALMLSVPGLRARIRALLVPPVWFALALALMATIVFQPPGVLFLISLLIPVLLAGTVLRSSGLVGQLLEVPALKWVGRMSYSLYLWQQLFLIQRYAPQPVPFPQLQTFPMNLVMIFACAAASYYLIERPAIRLGHRLARPATAGRADLQP